MRFVQNQIEKSHFFAPIRFFALKLVVILGLLASFGGAAEANSRYAAIVVEEDSGRVLFSRNADKKLYPASLTKIMTLYMVFEALQQGRLSLNTQMRVSRVAASRSPSKLYLKPGQTISTEAAILALVTKSANDVATVVAEHLSGTERKFAVHMTERARSLGMNRTTFKNASGLPNRAQKSTARDMYKLGRAIRRDFPHYYHYFSRTSFRYNGKVYRNHNRLLTRYSGTDGIKTGYTGASGFNLVAAVERNGVRLIGVVFGGRTGATRDAHMMKILSTQFKRVKPIQVASIPKSLPIARPNGPERTSALLRVAQVSAPKTNILRSDENSLSLSASAPPAVSDRDDITPWLIQVGSFSRRVTAHKAAIAARRMAEPALATKPANLSIVMQGDMPLWRVRFEGLAEAEARAACASLFEKGSACFALPITQGSQDEG